MNRPVQGQDFEFEISLTSRADSNVVLASPTILAGEFTLGIDGAVGASLTTLPAFVVGDTKRVKVKVLAAELAACVKGFNILGVDANAEWADYPIYFPIKKLARDTYSVNLYDVAGNELPGLATGTIAIETKIDGGAWSGPIAGRVWVEDGYGVYTCTNGLPLAYVNGKEVFVRVKAPLSQPATVVLGEPD